MLILRSTKTPRWLPQTGNHNRQPAHIRPIPIEIDAIAGRLVNRFARVDGEAITAFLTAKIDGRRCAERMRKFLFFSYFFNVNISIYFGLINVRFNFK